MPCRERRLRFFIAVKKLAREIFELWQEERFEFEDVDGMGKEEEASGAERLRTSRWAALARREESGGVRERERVSVCRGGGEVGEIKRAGPNSPEARQPQDSRFRDSVSRLGSTTEQLSCPVCPSVRASYVCPAPAESKIENATIHRDRNVSIKSAPQRPIGGFYLPSFLDFPIIVKPNCFSTTTVSRLLYCRYPRSLYLT